MNWQRPTPAVVWRAIEIYLRQAYAGPPPSAVRARLDTLRSTPESEFYASPVFERDASASGPTGSASKFALRLGNRDYPHMKLIIDRAPDGRRHLFRADTHDAHCQPAAGSREHRVFCELMQANRATADAVEAAWEAASLPTFKQFLRDDLAARRKAEETTRTRATER